MTTEWNRRDVLKGIVAASTCMMVPASAAEGREDIAISTPLEIQVTSISPSTFRLSILPLKDGSVASIPYDGSLVQQSWGSPIATLRSDPRHSIEVGAARLNITFKPITVSVLNERGQLIERLVWDQKSNVLSLLTGNAPLLGLGEGGPQYDRRGSVDLMRSG